MDLELLLIRLSALYDALRDAQSSELTNSQANIVDNCLEHVYTISAELDELDTGNGDEGA